MMLVDGLKYLLPHVPGCPDVVALDYLKQALKEFCEETLLYQRILDPITLVDNKSTYDLDVDDGYVVETVVRAFIGYRRLIPVAPPFLRPWPGGSPGGFFEYDDTTITLFPSLTVAPSEQLTVTVALKPLLTVSEIDDDFFADYIRDIAAGAASMLAQQPKQAYSNPLVASQRGAQFNAAISNGKIAFNRGTAQGELRVVFPPQ